MNWIWLTIWKLYVPESYLSYLTWFCNQIKQDICESMPTSDTPALMWIYKISEVDI